MSIDFTDVVWERFYGDRTKSIWDRFPGFYRSLIVETNDPLNMNRIRFRCPEMHDSDLDVNLCPWAVPCTDMGGTRAGRFVSPVIGDWVFISFEKQHPYAPIWVGCADPTRTKMYALPQVHNITPIPVNQDGDKTSRPNDYDDKYLPKDGRPMQHGWVDRYGNADIHSSVGYFPIQHDNPPPPPGNDAISGQSFEYKKQKPLVNNPDKKYIARITKYGHIFIMGDQGYHWKKNDDTSLGEFYGDSEKDDKFETKRWLFLQRLLNDNVANSSMKGGDQRKILLQTRYGTRIEMRDVGWAQQGPVSSKSREGEFGPSRTLSEQSDADGRWLKLRTKGGMLMQFYDKGFHPQDDKFVSRHLLQESGFKSEREDKHWGDDKDARWIRFVTRHGFKFVLDDRGSSTTDASGKELPRGNGILLKGRRTPSTKDQNLVGNQRGFSWEFNENDKANHTMWCSPLGNTIEMNDRYQYVIMCSTMGKNWVRRYMGLKENEFIRKPTMINDPEKNSHHLKLDHENEYIRLKTRARKGPRPRLSENPSGVAANELNQGFEARDGSNGDGPWVELVDCQHRGMWFSKKSQIGVWRARQGRSMYQWFDDRQRKIVIHNNEQNGTIEIYANRAINVISNGNINLRSDNNINIRSAKAIRFQAGTTKLTIADNSIRTNADYFGSSVNAFLNGAFPGPGAGIRSPGGATIERIENTILPDTLEPKDRGAVYNQPFEECPIEEVQHTI